MLIASAYTRDLTCSIIRTQYTGVWRAIIFAVFVSFYHQKNVWYDTREGHSYCIDVWYFYNRWWVYVGDVTVLPRPKISTWWFSNYSLN